MRSCSAEEITKRREREKGKMDTMSDGLNQETTILGERELEPEAIIGLFIQEETVDLDDP